MPTRTPQRPTNRRVRASRRRTPLVAGTSAVLGASLAIGAGALGLGTGGTTTVTAASQPTAVTTRDVSNATTSSAASVYAAAAPSVVQVTAAVSGSSTGSGTRPSGGAGSDPYGSGSGGSGADPYGSGADPYGGSGGTLGGVAGTADTASSGESIGSGFVVDDQGTILTNEHVVDGASSVRVTVTRDGKRRTVAAKVLGTDPSTDLAALRIDPSGLDLQPLALGSSSDTEVGDEVLAIGNPYGLDQTLTTGVLSAKDRQISSPDGTTLSGALQTDAAINEGSSGGPLLNASGQVIGITSQIATSGTSTGNLGIGFAIPIETVREHLAALESGSSDGSTTATTVGTGSATR